MKRTRLAVLCGLSVMLVAPPGANAQPAPPAVRVDLGADQRASDDATEIAKKLQNPIGDLISVPFTNYTNFNVGPNKGTQDILQIQPVVPIHVN